MDWDSTIETPSNILYLPSDILLEFASHLDVHDLYLMSWSCKKFRAVSYRRWYIIRRIMEEEDVQYNINNLVGKSGYVRFLWRLGKPKVCMEAAKSGNLSLLKFAMDNQFGQHCRLYELLECTVLNEHPDCTQYLVDREAAITKVRGGMNYAPEWIDDIKMKGCPTCKTIHFNYRCPFKNVWSNIV